MNTKESAPQEFSGMRAALWPIHGYELKKFLPLAFIMFCLLFNYTILRDTKDTLVVNSAGAGAITFLKLYCVTPAAILFVILYAMLTQYLKRETVFYAVVTPFVVFFTAFAFLYPHLDTLHPSAATIQHLQQSYPNLSGFIDIYAYWAYSIFYVLAEIWGSAMIALMFWQFANHIVRMNESKRFYGLFAVVGNLALILSGQVVGLSSGDTIQQFFATKEQAWVFSVYLLMGAVAFFGILSMAIYRWMHVSVLTDKKYFDPEVQAPTKKKKEKPSLIESAKLIFTSPELGLIAILIMAYGITINLVEVQWKHQLGLWYAGDKGGYNWFMGQFSTVTGIITILFGLFLGSNILRRVSWFKAAVITPIIIAVGGTIFFAFIFSEEFVNFIMKSMSVTAVASASILGALIVILSKAVKYILFDSTKEMAYIPLNNELKTKGKAAVDVIGGRAGKAGGAFTQSTLLILFATKDVVVIAPIAFAVFAVICVAWFFAVKMLSGKVASAMKARKEEAAQAEPIAVTAKEGAPATAS